MFMIFDDDEIIYTCGDRLTRIETQIITSHISILDKYVKEIREQKSSICYIETISGRHTFSFGQSPILSNYFQYSHWVMYENVNVVSVIQIHKIDLYLFIGEFIIVLKGLKESIDDDDYDKVIK